MYWGKKILEWTPSDADAYQIAVSLNDRYELDGRDPNGYAGIACASAGSTTVPGRPDDRLWDDPVHVLQQRIKKIRQWRLHRQGARY
jgi:hypothetical protein